MKITAQGLVKAYKGRRVVDGVSFSFDQGEVVALLGPNGAGKTTTFYMVTGLIQPNEGSVSFDDQDAKLTRRESVRLGATPRECYVLESIPRPVKPLSVQDFSDDPPQTVGLDVYLSILSTHGLLKAGHDGLYTGASVEGPKPPEPASLWRTLACERD